MLPEQVSQERIESTKKWLLDDFSYFAQCFTEPEFYDEEFHTDLCRFLQFSGPNKLVVLPRTYLKTTIVSLYTLWKSTRNTLLRSLITSNTTPNAQKTVRSVRSIVENNQLYQLFFPEKIPNFAKVRWSDSCACLKREIDHPEGTFESAGVGSNIIRRHFNIIVEDDTVAPKKDELTGEEAMPSKDDIEKAVGFHRLTIPLLINEFDERIVVGTRWASYDLINWVIENEKFDIFDRKCFKSDGKPLYKRFSQSRLDNIKMGMGTYMFCTPRDAPILMGNSTSKAIKDVQVSDIVTGFILSNPGDKQNSRLVASKVIAKGSLFAPIYNVYMKSGRVIKCTKDHQWLANLRRGRSGHHPSYRTLESSLQYPLTLHYICDPQVEKLPDSLKELAIWLGGIFDGEGSCTKHLVLAQHKIKHKDVYDKIVYALEALNFSFKVYERNEEDVQKVLKGTAGNCIIVFGTSWEDRRRFLLWCNPVKKDSILESLYISRFCKEEDDVDFFEVVGKEEVFWLQTETGNYISQGYASKNSMLYLNSPLAKEFMAFNPDWYQYYEENELPEDGDTIVTIDPADPPTGAVTQDFTAILSAKHTAKGLFIRRYRRKRLSDGQLIAEALDVARLDDAVKVRIEVNRYAHLEAGFREEMAKRGEYFIIDTVKAKRIQKDARIKNRLSPLFENGVVYMKRGMRELEAELHTFPYGKHDDLLDALSWQIERYQATEYEKKIEERPKLPTGRRVFTLEEIRESCRKQHKPPYPFSRQADVLMPG